MDIISTETIAEVLVARFAIHETWAKAIAENMYHNHAFLPVEGPLVEIIETKFRWDKTPQGSDFWGGVCDVLHSEDAGKCLNLMLNPMPKVVPRSVISDVEMRIAEKRRKLVAEVERAKDALKAFDNALNMLID
jgi:hypothetical protein